MEQRRQGGNNLRPCLISLPLHDTVSLTAADAGSSEHAHRLYAVGCKFAGCIWLMLFFIRKFVKENPQADNSSSFRFGIITSLLSALIYSAASFANTAFINKELFTEQMDMIMQSYARIMDSNTMNAMEKMLDMMPQITFFSTLAYCFLFGTALSAILSRNIPSRDPFAPSQPE